MSSKGKVYEGFEAAEPNGFTDAATDAANAAAEDAGPDFDLDQNLVHLGVKGLYPTGLYLVIAFFIFLSPSLYLSGHVNSETPVHRCRLPEEADLNRSIPVETDAAGVEVFARCELFHPNDTWEDFAFASPNASARRRVPCDRGWEYLDVDPGTTVVVEFDLVCSDGWMAGFATAIFSIGEACGGMMVQPLGDRFGRKWMMLGTTIGIGLSGVLSATVANGALSYLALKFVLGVFFAGFLLTGFVMQLELYAAKHRMWAGMLSGPLWGLGSAAVGLMAWLLPQWRHYTLATSIPFFFSIFVIFIFPADSLPWLMVNRRHEEVEDYLERKLEDKGKKLIRISSLEPLQKKPIPELVVENKWRMMTNFHVIKQLVIFSFVSTVNSLVFYALTLMSTDLSGDRNVSLFLAGVVEIPGSILAVSALHFMGRRGPTVLFHVLVGVFMTIVASIQILGPTPLPKSLDVFSQICYFAAKLTIASSYSVVFLFVPEVFPTNIRSTSVGLIDAIARLGGVVAPYSSYLAAASHPSVPVFIFAVLSFISAILILFLPECHNETLPDTLDDLKYLIEGTRFWNMRGVRKRKRIRGSKREVEVGESGA